MAPFVNPESFSWTSESSAASPGTLSQSQNKAMRAQVSVSHMTKVTGVYIGKRILDLIFKSFDIMSEMRRFGPDVLAQCLTTVEMITLLSLRNM